MNLVEQLDQQIGIGLAGCGGRRTTNRKFAARISTLTPSAICPPPPICENEISSMSSSAQGHLTEAPHSRVVPSSLSM